MCPADDPVFRVNFAHQIVSILSMTECASSPQQIAQSLACQRILSCMPSQRPGKSSLLASSAHLDTVEPELDICGRKAHRKRSSQVVKKCTDCPDEISRAQMTKHKQFLLHCRARHDAC
eukprot:6200041-Pleurochrysis_carterae.AAC.2